jgi:hypothetical protein
VSDGTLDEGTLVWKEGMTDWEEAGTVDSLSGLFQSDDSTPPSIP